ncbi:MAG: sigma-70 family RNA polymerase sigma factor [Burkholderiaceae bacterium]
MGLDKRQGPRKGADSADTPQPGTDAVRHRQTTLTLYTSHRKDLVSYAGQFSGDRALAEDIVQEAWLRFDRATAQRFLDEPLGYLKRIVRNIALDGRRREQVEIRLLLPQNEAAVDTTPDESPSPEAQLLQRERLALVEAAFAELPERTRIAVRLHRVENKKIREIAEHLGLSTSYVHSLIVEGVEHCRKRLQGE